MTLVKSTRETYPYKVSTPSRKDAWHFHVHHIVRHGVPLYESVNLVLLYQQLTNSCRGFTSFFLLFDPLESIE
jgi:hypothetical protein